MVRAAPEAPAEENRVTTFTGKKLDLLKAVRLDRTMPDSAYRVLSVIVDHLNEETGRTKLSDETIAFEAGSNVSSVKRARKALHPKWLIWARTRDANIYSVHFDAVAPILEMLKKAREAKKQTFNKTADKFGQIGRKRPISPQLGAAPADRPKVVDLDRPEVAHIHPIGTPFKQEAYGIRLREESLANGGRAESAERASPPSDVLTIEEIREAVALAARQQWALLEALYPGHPWLKDLREISDDDGRAEALRQLLQLTGMDERTVASELRAAFGGFRLN
jgi:hypothetical protein